MKKNKKHGFTIVELLIVVAVIAILAVVSIVTYVGMQRRASSAVTVDSIKSATDIVLLEEVSKRGIPDSIDTMFTSHPDVDVRFTRIVDPGGLPYYGALTEEQSGKLFSDICVELVADGYGKGPNDFGSNTIDYISGCHVYGTNDLQINGWNGGFNVSNPSVTEERLYQYVDTAATSHPLHPSYRATLERFMSTLISRFKAQGGDFPITSFWKPWEGTPSLPLPTSITKEERTFCIIASHKKYPDITYVSSSENPTPEPGVGCS